jgi:hypothetical protein
MPAKDFKFISPGVFINEIDNSQLPSDGGDIGPVIIGRSDQGPALVPTRVSSFQEFVQVFGAPRPGGNVSDVSRECTPPGPTYGTYAAQAWLKNSSPITYVRLVGQQNTDAADGGEAGWALSNGTSEVSPSVGSAQGGAYGLFVFPSSSAGISGGELSKALVTGTLAATWYVTTGSVALSGTLFSGSESAAATVNLTSTVGAFAHSTSFTINVPTSIGGEDGNVTILFGDGAGTGGANQIRIRRDAGGISEKTAANLAQSLVFAINGTTPSGATPTDGGTYVSSDVGFATSGRGSSGVAGVTASRDGATVTITADTAGTAGNGIVLTDVGGTPIATSAGSSPKSLAGGAIGGLIAEPNLAGFDSKATNKYVKSVGNGEFKVVISNGSGVEIDSKFDFTNSSANFVRKVFNTNPTLTNSDITDSTSDAYRTYWLGETFEDEVSELFKNSTSQFGVILPLFSNAGTVDGGDFLVDYKDPQTGFFISQDLTNNSGSFDAKKQEKLFRLVARNTGRWASKNIKVSIADIRASSDPANPYGTFSVQIRAMEDTDNRPKVLEQFNNCNLNPTSENFVARKIGDKFLQWDDDERRYIEYGDFVNNSDYIYIELTDAVREGKTSPEHLPFGVFGPPAFKSFFANGTSATQNTLVTGGIDYASAAGTGFENVGILVSGSTDFGVQLDFPALRLRVSSSEGNPIDPRAVYYGVDTTFNKNGRPSKTIGEYTGAKPAGVSSLVADSSADAQTEDMFIFTLDDICTTDQDPSTALTGTLVYKSGSRQGSTDGLTNVRAAAITGGSYREVLNLGADRFTTVLHGGFDGLDITEAEPFRNTLLNGKAETTSYAYNSVRVAIDSLRDPENVEYDIAAIPGLTNPVLNRNLIDMVEGRGDALAVIDLEGGYIPTTEGTQSVTARLGDVDTTINNKRQNLQINSSFGAAYYPWVQIQDTINGALLWAPPSVAAIGAMSYGQATQELWFAPAGFTRGGLSINNAAGVPVVGVRQRLISKERDKLYEANINPIAQFPAEGIVIFGQKTLQVTPSALDRINVRRLLIFLKKEISRVAATLLFDQNVQTTWDRFRGQVEPFLASVKVRLGLTDYKLVLDETTTTPDLIDRNILYAQIFLKPARAIEFIAIDFVITDSGAAFDD